MGKARARRREELRQQGKLLPKNAINTGRKDIPELVPVMEKLGMSNEEKDRFQRAVLDYLIMALNEEFDEEGELVPVQVLVLDALPKEHRDAGYNFIIDLLEQRLSNKTA